MKKFYMAVFATIGFTCHAQIIDMDAAFKEAVLWSHPEIDANADGEIEVSEATTVTILNLGTFIADWNGIEHFPNLVHFETRGSSSSNELDFSSLSQLEYIDFHSMTATINSLNLSGLANLKHVNVQGAYLSTLDLAASINSLEYLNISDNTPIDAVDYTAYPNLNHLECANLLATVNVAGMSQLEYLDVSDNYLESLDLTGLPNLKYLNCGINMITSLDVGTMTSLEYLNCAQNGLTVLAVENLTNLQYLNCSNNQLNALQVGNLTNLTTLECEINTIPTLALSNLTNLTRLVISGNPLAVINLTPLTNLTYLKCAGNQLTSLNLLSQTNLTHLTCSGNQLTTLDLSAMQNLLEFYCDNNLLTSLDLANISQLRHMSCQTNSLATLDLSPCPLIETFKCNNNQLTEIDLSNATKLRDFAGSWNLFETLDFSAFQSPDNVTFETVAYSFHNNPQLSYVNMKNGAGYFMLFYDPLQQLACPNLVYVCSNEAAIAQIKSELQTHGAPNVQVNSYCSFVPGGAYNSILGNVTFDLDANGCGVGDSNFAGVKVNIAGGMTSGATFTDGFGNYGFPVGSGVFTLTPVVENEYFAITPASATIDFPMLDQTSQTAAFCISPNGIHKDLEITIIPVVPARPGFDANYFVSYRNKGNQTLSGTVSLTFYDDVLEYVASTPAVTNQAQNLLQWDFAALQPFESRLIDVTVNVNSPIETPAVNINDFLSFTAAITPNEDDETIEDNVYVLNQIVVGSYDPNDKTCIEGNAISPDMVGDYLHYLIRFQNSGTFYAENVVVSDMIDATKFDISTLRLIASSHQHETRITGNKVEFIFEGINLPAEQDDEPGSHGFVAFKIKTKPTLVLDEVVENTAEIFFDFNLPIVTNTASTIIALLGLDDTEDPGVSLSPNPVRNMLNVSARDNITSIQVFDIQGRLLQTAVANDTVASIDFSSKTSGVYLVRVATEKGITVQKIIKE